MSRERKGKAPTRREFFKLAGLGAGTVAAATVVSKSARAAEAEASDRGAGYQETEHVKQYYELAKRF